MSDKYKENFLLGERRFNKPQWTNDIVLNGLVYFLIGKKSLSIKDIEKVEIMLVLIQNHFVNNGHRPIMVYKTYIDEGIIYHKYLSDVIRLRPIVPEHCLYVYQDSEIVQECKKMTIDELKSALDNAIKNNLLNDDYFVLKKYNGPNFRGYARFTNRFSGKYMYITLYFTIIGSLFLMVLLLIYAFYFLGLLNVNYEYLMKRQNDGLIVIASSFFINIFIYKKVIKIFRTPTKYEKKIIKEDTRNVY